MVSRGLSAAPHVERARRVVLVVDMADAVRLIDIDEEGVVARWLDLVRQIENELVPASRARLITSTGDGLLLQFDDARTAVLAAFAIQQANLRGNRGQPTETSMRLRIGIEESDVIVNQGDVFGHGVNLAAGLTALAGPGEVVVSATVREQITPELDADVEDLGDCVLNNVEKPMRAYRLHPPGAPVLPRVTPSSDNLLPTLAVIPFTGHGIVEAHEVLGHVVAEELIRNLSRSHDLNVISRLSTTAFSRRIVSLDEVRDRLNASYALSGIYWVEGDVLRLSAELADIRSSRIVWSQQIDGDIRGIIAGDSDIISTIFAAVRSAIVTRETRRSQSLALPTLESFSLLLGAINLMHRLSKADFERARDMLEVLVERAPRQAIPRAWLAQWYVLRVQQGWTVDPKRDNQTALALAKAALDADPESSHALAIDGLVHNHLLKRLDVARERFDRATKLSPNDPLAWLLSGMLYAFTDEGELAVEQTETALSLSPLDPLRYYFDSLTASAHLTAGNWEKALELSKRSLRANRSHTSTLRVMAVAQWHLGQHEAARETSDLLMTLEPNLTISGYLKRTPSADFRIGREIARILRKVGVPD